ncbi:hypothetical protein CORC01_12758 [Colletotrichum orchidophilum]|uniref:C2H2-type domain-containing protein n=1 Tax=Colletotrichum orchidophilum TaxID=1209926 RepID=A0A1G4AS34_9PEZI|nr:uncharacterized protein CORC01_12758 [Colletotrichum orchidophilum]OHE91970.1 hypothetical protein CORC01_12758 [Colletotrichum orchidophilum]
MTSLLRLPGSLLFSSDSVANRLPTLGPTGWGQSSLVDIWSNAADALRSCPPLFNSLFASLSKPSQINLTHVHFSPAGIAVLPIPFGPPLNHPVVQHGQPPVFEHGSVKRQTQDSLHDVFTFNSLAACGACFYLLKPAAAALLADWVPTAAPCSPGSPCLSPKQRSLDVGSSWLPLNNPLAHLPPIPHLLRGLFTKSWRYLEQLVARLRRPGHDTAGDGPRGPAGSASGPKKRRKQSSRSSGNSTSSDTSRKKSRRGGSGQKIAVASRTKARSKGKLFACHFYANDTVTHSGCRHYKFEHVKDIKRHFTVKSRGNHRQPIHCVICFSLFDTSDELGDHLREQGCQRGVCTFDNSGLNEDQIGRIRDLKMSDHENEKEFWYAIWDIVFPGQQRPFSPYLDDVEELATRQQVDPWMVEGMQGLNLSDHVLELVMNVYNSIWSVPPSQPLVVRRLAVPPVTPMPSQTWFPFAMPPGPGNIYYTQPPEQPNYNFPSPEFSFPPPGFDPRQAIPNQMMADFPWPPPVDDSAMPADVLGAEGYQCNCRREPGKPPQICYLHR